MLDKEFLVPLFIIFNVFLWNIQKVNAIKILQTSKVIYHKKRSILLNLLYSYFLLAPVTVLKWKPSTFISSLFLWQYDMIFFLLFFPPWYCDSIDRIAFYSISSLFLWQYWKDTLYFYFLLAPMTKLKGKPSNFLSSLLLWQYDMIFLLFIFPPCFYDSIERIALTAWHCEIKSWQKHTHTHSTFKQ